MATDITSYLDFVMTLFMAFGVAFEVPIAIVLLCWTGVTTPEMLRQKRPYMLVGAFVVGMLLTPPDVFRKLCSLFRCTACLRLAYSVRASM